MSYNPPRVMRQFDFEQVSSTIASKISLSNIHNSKSRFINGGHDHILSSFEIVFLVRQRQDRSKIIERCIVLDEIYPCHERLCK